MTRVLQQIRVSRRRPLFALVSGFIDADVREQVYSWRREIHAAAGEDKLDVLIHSPGGDLTSCYMVARLLARCTNAWQALVPAYAASGATLICLGSSQVVMAEGAQLGPIDPQVLSKRREKFFAMERQSPLEAFQAVQYLRAFALSSLDAAMTFLLDPRRAVAPHRALETAREFGIRLVQPVLEKIEPYDLGAFALDSNFAVLYCQRIATPPHVTKQTQRNVSYRDLVERYPAHVFAIDLAEAEVLKFNVAAPDSEQLDDLFDELRTCLRNVETYIGLVPADGESAQ